MRDLFHRTYLHVDRIVLSLDGESFYTRTVEWQCHNNSHHASSTTILNFPPFPIPSPTTHNVLIFSVNNMKQFETCWSFSKFECIVGM